MLEMPRKHRIKRFRVGVKCRKVLPVAVVEDVPVGACYQNDVFVDCSMIGLQVQGAVLN